MRGEDIQVELTIDFDDAYHGTSKEISYKRRIKAEGVEEKTCETCKGRGKVAQKAQTPFGVMQVQSACPTCKGLGKLFTKHGKQLSGGPFEKINEHVTVNIPAAIKNGVFIKFAGKGDAGVVGSDGDLYVKIRIRSSSEYERKGDDLYVRAQVSIYTMVLG